MEVTQMILTVFCYRAGGKQFLCRVNVPLLGAQSCNSIQCKILLFNYLLGRNYKLKNRFPEQSVFLLVSEEHYFRKDAVCLHVPFANFITHQSVYLCISQVCHCVLLSIFVSFIWL